jgi:hypothetical protein
VHDKRGVQVTPSQAAEAEACKEARLAAIIGMFSGKQIVPYFGFHNDGTAGIRQVRTDHATMSSAITVAIAWNGVVNSTS